MLGHNLGQLRTYVIFKKAFTPPTLNSVYFVDEATEVISTQKLYEVSQLSGGVKPHGRLGRLEMKAPSQIVCFVWSD